jgi:hypothetical protein
VHSYSDFNLHIPANFMMLMAIMAIGCSAVFLQYHPEGGRPAFRYWVVPVKYGGAVVLIAMIAVMGWAGVWTVRHAAAEGYCNTVNNSTLNSNPRPPIENIAKAIGWNPSNAQYWYKLGAELMRLRRNGKIPEDAGTRATAAMKQLDLPVKKTLMDCFSESDPNGAGKIACQQAAVYAMEQAAILNPFEASYHLILGWEYTRFAQYPDFKTKWLPAADAAMKRAAVMTGDVNKGMQESLGHYWIMRAATYSHNSKVWEEAWGNALLHYRKAHQITKGNHLKLLQKRVGDFVMKYYPQEAMEWDSDETISGSSLIGG